MAPELVSGSELEGPELDAFSLGAIAYHLFSGHPPAARVLDLADKLAASGGALDLRDVVNPFWQDGRDVTPWPSFDSLTHGHPRSSGVVIWQFSDMRTWSGSRSRSPVHDAAAHV